MQTGEQGELWVSGEQVMRGYWQDEEKSRQVFARFNGKKYYKTGDLCSVDPEGDIIYCKGYERDGEYYTLTAYQQVF